MIKLDSCLIIKNEEENITPLINQLLLFSHEIHITDTGSTDNTLSILEEFEKTHNNIFIHHYEWDMNFSNARNYSLHYDNDTSDYKFWCDADDQLNDEMITRIKEFINDDTINDDIYYMKYKYYANDNDPHFRTSVLKTSADLKWNDPIHEYIGLFNGIKLNYDYFNNGPLLIHHRKEIHTNRNLEIFQNMEKIGAVFTGRNYYYYGRELLNHGLKESAYEMFKRCIYYEENYDIQDKVNSLNAVYDIHPNDKWLEMFFYLLQHNIYRGDIFYYAGNFYLNKRKNNFLAKVYYNAALNYEYDNNCAFGLYMNNITINPLLQLGVIAYNEGDNDKCREYNERVLEYDPENITAKNNILFLNNSK